MQKYKLCEGIQIDSFTDGEAVVYDANQEMIHILNVTATMVLKSIIEKNESTKENYVKMIMEMDPATSLAVIENDYDNIVKQFVEAGILGDR